MGNLLTVKNLNVTLEDQSILENVNFELAQGENLAVIGPNGSGKTVLLRSLMGTVEFSGEIIWDEKTRVGYVPQKIEADRHLPITIANLLSAKAQIFKFPLSEVEWAVNSAKLTKNILETPVGHLSGGQFQRALIAFALLGHPNVLLLDEPTASIDERGEEQIYELLHELQDKYKIAAILVSHDLSYVYRYATKVLCVNKQGMCYGIPEETLTPQVLDKLYGGPHKYYRHEHDQDSHS